MAYPFQRRSNRNHSRNVNSNTTGAPLSSTGNVPFQQSNRITTADEFGKQTEYLIPAEVRMISGCHSLQTSADLHQVSSVAQLPNPAGRSGGACTSALLEILYRRRSKPLTFQEILLQLRESLSRQGLDQIPQLTSSRPLDLQQTPFALSQPGGVGTSRALLIGINYRGQHGELNGCHNDCRNVETYLLQVQGYSPANITLLLDDNNSSRINGLPTRQAILSALHRLVTLSRAGDSVYIHYSGHGGLLDPESNAFKANQKEYDETIFPLDHARAGQIRDVSLFHRLVQPMPAGVLVTCVMDCCHSGAVLDLPYSFRPTPTGSIQMERNANSLANLAFLYVLGGGQLPSVGFESVTSFIEHVTGGALDDFLGTALEELQHDALDAYDDLEDNATTNDIPVVQGEVVDDHGANGALWDDFAGGGGNVVQQQGEDIDGDGTFGFDGGNSSRGMFEEDVTGGEGMWEDTNAADDGLDCDCFGDFLGDLFGRIGDAFEDADED